MSSNQIDSSTISSSFTLIQSIIGYLTVGILWGCTNPYIKRAQTNTASLDSEKEQSNKKYISKILSSLTSLRRLLTDPLSMIPYILNQTGSLAFYFILANEPVTRAAPISNALAFIFTAITSYFVLGEHMASPIMMSIGIILVILGTYICLTSSV
jgi:hypothetical protein